MSTVIDVERAVNERYGQAAKAPEPELCCAVDYDAKYLRLFLMRSKSATMAAATHLDLCVKAISYSIWVQARARFVTSRHSSWVLLDVL